MSIEPEIIIPQSMAIQQAETAMIDIQISTAKQYPRTLSAVKERVLLLATVDQSTAIDCHYALPRGDKVINGPSVRLAEIIVASYGNIRSKWYTVSEEEKSVSVRGMCWDLESNTANEVEVKRNIWGQYGRYSADMIVMTTNAAGAIAFRNAVFKTIPLSLFNSEINSIKMVAAGDGKSIDDLRLSCVEKFKAVDFTPTQMCKLVNKRKPADLEIDDIVVLGNVYKSLIDGTMKKADLLKQAKEDEKAKTGLKADEGKIT